MDDGRRDFRGVEDLVHSVLMDVVDRAERSAPTLPGVPTGLDDLDRATGGLRPGGLTVVGGRPGMGKSAFALGVAARYALEQEKPVVVFSLEASADDAMSMLLASTAMVDVQRISVAVGGATRQEWERLGRAADQLASAPLRIVEECVTPEAISARIDGIAERRGVALVVVDCLHLMETDPEGPPAVNREQQLAVIVRSLKRLARRHRVPILCTAQLGRSVDSRVDKRPRLTDLRDSGAIEDAADLVLLLYRDDYYDFDSDEKGIAEIWVEKNRFGSAGYFIHAAFLGCYARFGNLAPIEASPTS